MDLYQLFGRALVVFTSIPIHGYAHAWATDKLGDKTAKSMGLLDINPFKHLDLVGTFLILFVGFGWSKPVPVNPNNFADRKKGMAIASLAGPFANIVLGAICLILFKLSVFFATNITVSQILLVMVTTNISLAIFNLIPIPPLHGWNILSLFIPKKIYYKIAQKQRDISMIFILIILFVPILNIPMSFLTSMVLRLLDTATSFIPMPFTLF